MAHDAHHHEEKQPLSLFASPLNTHGHALHHNPPASTNSSSDLESALNKDPHTTTNVPFENTDCALHDSPAFHRHAEATTAELFYDLFFVANLTTFTSMLEINDHNSLTAYIGFFSLLWLTWYQVSLYDVRFSADSVFERVAKAIHFGVMVGFAVIGPQWKPGQDIGDYKIYKAFGLILMVSRITLFLQYGVTLFYTKKYTKTIVPLLLVMGSTLVAAILYGALTPAFPSDKTVLDAFGDEITGIIVICKSISKIVKNEFLWTAAVVGQIIAAVLIIYFLYMLYFDRMQEEHFGSIKQQVWSFCHFPLHVVLVLVLQGVSLLIIWTQAMDALNVLYVNFDSTSLQNYTTGADFAAAMNETAYANVFDWVPKGVDASKEISQANTAVIQLADAYDFLMVDETNVTATNELYDGLNELFAAATKTLFDSLSVTTPKKKKADDGKTKSIDFATLFFEYVSVFELVFMYVFIAGGLSLIITTILGFLSLPASQRRVSQYVRLGVNLVFGVGLCLISTLKYNWDLKANYLSSPWMIPTLCIVYFVCVVVNHISLPKRKMH
ncbi:hypothetical protein BU26DRAFT_424254 [Trematosphaeria pertusa]|uniref:Low temperature requirement A n=1 Tax=Trematosphaeria pertusa TaxID=390896 RepID=A0A6A6IMI4_9PLEO|nr:uncharacterized protein BU26DRAFT_424254 [Trematosphaeria pertusa]KAF2250693.1 hypothetical protein BU26DRAFT_424254 [Trematosphaeria pertusa]